MLIYIVTPCKTVDVLYVFPVICYVHKIFFIQFVVDAKSTLKMNFDSISGMFSFGEWLLNFGKNIKFHHIPMNCL